MAGVLIVIPSSEQLETHIWYPTSDQLLVSLIIQRHHSCLCSFNCLVTYSDLRSFNVFCDRFDYS